jgi:uncharacterized membrane protein SpoIIM required for sporulation
MESTLRDAEQGELSSLSHEGARRFVDLYRRASADLVLARTYGAGAEVVSYLETLVARGYSLLYPPPPLHASRSVVAFFRDRFPRAVRRERRALGLVTAAFLAGIVLGGVTTSSDPEAARLFVPSDHQQQRPRERVAREEEAARSGKTGHDAHSHAAFSAFLFTHNISVSITCFAIGIAWGLPTLLLVGYHGVFLAALAVDYFRDGQALFFLAWILPHGLVELFSMLLAGTAGLLLGRGVLWPRGKPRGERVREEARSALELLGGAAALLIVAGVVEGTISQIHEPTLGYPSKIGFAVVLFLLVQSYLWLLPLPPAEARIHSAPRPLNSR